MSFALSAGVTGLQAHQKMLDVAGNNLANVNTTAFKASRITFSELLSETIKKASSATTDVGGTNPQQMGSGVGISGIMPNMAQGNLINTGNPLDLAIEGGGYFVLRSSSGYVYTRAGAFAVDEEKHLVDPATGYLVQRIGSTGESDGFQSSGSSNINVPYGVSMPAKATTTVTVAGNLSADATLEATQTNEIKSNITYTTNNGTTAALDTDLDDLDQWTTGTFGAPCRINVSGYEHDGTPLADVAGLTVDANTDLQGVINHINTILQAGTGTDTAVLENGRIVITAGDSGYSKSDVKLTFTNTGGTADWQEPEYFEISTVGGEEVKSLSLTVFDALGGRHVLSGAFVRTDTANEWDMVLTSITGNVYSMDLDARRIEMIQFDEAAGSYKGLGGSDTSTFGVTWTHDTATEQTITINMGTAGKFDGLTQFAGTSTAVAREQDGYDAGQLSAVSVDQEGTVIGSFSNGIKKNIATIQIALFQNPTALESEGSGYYTSSANSGEAVATQALASGAGSIHGCALEKSNADVATEFVTMIQAQNGFQANARTIRVANDILRELGNLIR